MDTDTSSETVPGMDADTHLRKSRRNPRTSPGEAARRV